MNKNLLYSQMKPNEAQWTNEAHFLEFYGMDSLTNSAICSLMSIKWTYLVLWVDS